MKLIFESLNEDKIHINEGMSPNIAILLLGGTVMAGTIGGAYIIGKSIDKLLSVLFKETKTTPPKNENDAEKAKIKLNKQLRVLKSINAIHQSKPNMIYRPDADIYDIVKMGIIDMPSIMSYISKFMSNLKRNTNDLIDIIEGEWDNELGANLIKKNNLIDVFGDNGGNEYLFDYKNNNIYYFDHEEGTVENFSMTYEELIISEADYIYDGLLKDGLLLELD